MIRDPRPGIPRTCCPAFAGFVYYPVSEELVNGRVPSRARKVFALAGVSDKIKPIMDAITGNLKALAG